jgi:dihydropyrimidinase
MPADIVVKNCKIVGTEGVVNAGIAIDEGKILAVAKDGSLPKADKTIDAKGRYVIPGVLDPHVHYALGRPYEEDCKSESRSAAGGGVTTMMLMTWDPTKEIHTGSVKEIFETAKNIAERHSIVDIVFHTGLSTDQQIREIPNYARNMGITSFKLPMMFRGKEAEAMGVPTFDDWKIFTSIKTVGHLGYPALAMIHAENMEIYDGLREKLVKEGRKDLGAWTEARPSLCEAVAVAKVIRFADYLDAPLYIVHMTSKEGISIAARAQAEGSRVLVETCPQYLALSWRDFPKEYALGKCAPPLRDRDHSEKLWWGIEKGFVHCIGSDHCAFIGKVDKTDIWMGRSGLPGLETLLPVMLSEGVNKGRISMEKLVEVCCYNPAKIFGLYPRKGSIAVGSDADLSIVDLKKRVKVTTEVLHSASDYTPFEGRELKGWPILTMVRGNVVMEDGEVIGKPGIGKYLQRKIE